MQKAVATETARLRGYFRKVIPAVKNKGGYGFIRTDDGLEAFTNIVDIDKREAFRAGTFVEFTLIENTAKGELPRAVRVKVL